MTTRKKQKKSAPGKTADEQAKPVPPAEETRGSSSGDGHGHSHDTENYFDRTDWIAFWTTLVVSLVAYLWTIAPDVTLEDSGELAVASFYAGVPHPPGYPIWTIYSWLFTKLVPISNIAFRVALSSAVAGVMSSAMLSLIVSRGSRRLLRGTDFIRNLPENHESWMRLLGGVVAGLMLTFNSVMWSQSVIVEVYSFSVCFFIACLLFLFRWTHSPEKDRYLYLSFLMFGVAVTSHQTLICAAMGIEVVIAVVRPALGRIFIAANGLVFLLVVIARALNNDMFVSLDNGVLNGIFWVVGLASLVIAVLMFKKDRSTGSILTSSRVVIICGALFLLTHLTYFFMPITSMTNPPMNWGYPRTEEGFWHAISRGQYDRINPTGSLAKFVGQVAMISQGAAEEFSIPLILLALLPLVFLRHFRRREQGWWLGMAVTFFGVAILLLVLLNPNTDAQSKTQTRVFFIPAHSILAMALGCSISLVSAVLVQAYRRFRDYAVIGGFTFLLVAFFNLVVIFTQFNYALPKFAYLLLFLASCGALVLIYRIRWRTDAESPESADAGSSARLVRFGMIGIGAAMPVFSAIAHWSDSEQRGHLFGYWFGHDMFTPPFGLYEEMEKDAILYGGTDPGRFCPTYMIFCESFIPDSKKRDPDFDRRDVYIITQNALADATYLDYLRAHYNRSRQQDPYFFQEFFRSRDESIKDTRTNFLARAVLPLDRFLTENGRRIEARRRLKGVYPEEEIYIPGGYDLFQITTNYTRRVREEYLSKGYQGDPFENGLISGVEHVMALNSELSRRIFEQNPDHAFYVEESFPLEWMNPHLTPYGIIMKLNREPVETLTPEMLDRDRQFWTQYSERLIGDWITPETGIEEICKFAVDFLSLRDASDYPTVDPKFFRDSQAQKSFSKLRGSQARLFAWHYRQAKARLAPQEEIDRLLLAAEFAYKQSFAYYPGSPEAVQGLSTLLYESERIEQAIKVVETALVIDPKNENFQYLMLVYDQPISKLQTLFSANPLNETNTINLIDAYWSMGDTNAAFSVIDDVAINENISKRLLTRLAEKVAKVPDLGRLRGILEIMTMKFPDSAEAFYDLASLQAYLGDTGPAIDSLEKALKLNNSRLAVNPEARDLRETLKTDARFEQVKADPSFATRIAPFLE